MFVLIEQIGLEMYKRSQWQIAWSRKRHYSFEHPYLSLKSWNHIVQPFPTGRLRDSLRFT
jgi:hypothetical protein